jgi:hypothetical protein
MIVGWKLKMTSTALLTILLKLCNYLDEVALLTMALKDMPTFPSLPPKAFQRAYYPN